MAWYKDDVCKESFISKYMQLCQGNTYHFTFIMPFPSVLNCMCNLSSLTLRRGMITREWCGKPSPIIITLSHSLEGSNTHLG